MEHRCGHRYATEAVVYISSRAGALLSTGILTDISISGGFIATPLPAAILSRVWIRFLAPYAMLPRIEGQVVRQAKTGLALEWLDFMPELVHVLTRAAPTPTSAQAARQLEPT